MRWPPTPTGPAMSIWRQPATADEINARFTSGNVNALLGVRL